MQHSFFNNNKIIVEINCATDPEKQEEITSAQSLTAHKHSLCEWPRRWARFNLSQDN